MWFCMLLVLVSVSVLFHISFGFGSGHLLGIAAQSVNRMFSLLCLLVALVVFHLGGNLILIASVPGIAYLLL